MDTIGCVLEGELDVSLPSAELKRLGRRAALVVQKTCLLGPVRRASCAAVSLCVASANPHSSAVAGICRGVHTSPKHKREANVLLPSLALRACLECVWFRQAPRPIECVFLLGGAVKNSFAAISICAACGEQPRAYNSSGRERETGKIECPPGDFPGAYCARTPPTNGAR